MSAAVLGANARAEVKDYGAACDGYALNRHDLDAPPGAEGVRFENVPGSDEAIKACEKAIEAAPQERRYVAQLARIELRAGKFDRALADYRKAAEAGSAMAMFSVGFMLENGCGVGKDHRAAISKYQDAAALGQTSAMINLAFAKSIGWDVAFAPDDAKELLERAATAGNADAMALLGDLNLYTEAGEPKAKPDLGKAFEWYRNAYKGGSPRSWWPLFLFYYHGLGENSSEAAAGSNAADVAHTAISEGSLAFARLMMANRKSLPTDIVRSVQSALKEKGYLSGLADGVFGSGTQTALRKLEGAIHKRQKEYGDTCRFGST
jgi:TPR repeat protein